MVSADLQLSGALSAIGTNTFEGRELAGVSQQALRAFANALLWRLFDAEQDRTLFTVNLWIYRKTFTVADLAPLLTAWVGPHP